MEFISLAEDLRRRARDTPRTPVFKFVDEDLSIVDSFDCHALAGAIDAVARHLRENEVVAGDAVLLVYPPSLDFVAAFAGCLAVGALPVPVFPPSRMAPAHELDVLSHIAANATATVALTTTPYDQLRRMSETSVWPSVRWLPTDQLAPSEALSEWYAPERGTPAFLQYTSGSTGRPRGVVITHGNLEHQLAMYRDDLHFGPNARMTFWVPPYHDLGLISGILAAIAGHGEATMMSPLSFLKRPAIWPEALHKFRATHTAAPNFAYDLVVRKTSPEQRAAWDLSALRVVLSGGEPIRPQTVGSFLDAFASSGLRPDVFCPAYGLAEHSVGVTFKGRSTLRANNHLEVGQPVSILGPDDSARALELTGCGVPKPDVDVRIVDPATCRSLADSFIGEIWVDSPSKAAGYWGDVEGTERLFHAQIAEQPSPPGYLRTGDLGFLHDGELYVCGRLKDVLIVGGRNVFPHDIEDTVRELHPVIRPGGVAVVAADDPDDPNLHVTVLCELREPLDSSAAGELIATIRRGVQRNHHLGCDDVVLGRQGLVLKTTSGKVRRSETRRRWISGELSEFAMETLEAPTSTGVAPTDVVLVLQRVLSEVVGLSPQALDTDTPLRELGVSSLQLVEFTERASDSLGVAVPPSLPFQAPTLNALGEALGGATTEPVGRSRVTARAGDPICVVGVGLRLPGGVTDLASFRKLLFDGVDAISEVPASRWAIDDWYDPDPSAPGKMITRCGGFVDDVESFEPGFFGISAREAASIDPQERLFLETSWEALESAGITKDELSGSNTGVFLGLTGNDYQARLFRHPDKIDSYALMGTAHSAIAGRLSYWLGLQGPNLAVDTACSSSLVALHLACQSLNNGECDLALAGGSNVLLAPEGTVCFSRLGAMSPTGHCHAFSEHADGYVRGEGAAMVTLERFSDAVKRDHAILGFVRGTAINQDGHRNGFTAPNGEGQQKVIRRALEVAGVDPLEVDYVECHGTGTPLGDPIEVSALAATYALNRPDDQPLLIGSIKSNIGHLEGAAGIAGFLKALLVLQEDIVPPSLHADPPNALIPWADIPVEVVTTPHPWPKLERPRRVAVSSFGLTGTNAHALIEAAPPAHLPPDRPPDERTVLLPLSAASAAGLDALSHRLRDEIAEGSHPIDLAFSGGVTRSHHAHRLALVANDIGTLREQLDEASTGETPPGGFRSTARSGTKLAFLYTGQGAQHPGMGRELARDWPVFDEALRHAANLCDAHLDRPLLTVMWPEEEHSKLIHQTGFTQPSLFAFEWALTALWRSFGVIPDLVCGHSIGEIVAACVAGSLSLEAAAKLVCSRGKLMQELPAGGAMLAVGLTEDEAREEIGQELSIAAINGPRAVVVSGPGQAIAELGKRLENHGVAQRRIEVSHAFHSALMNPMLDNFRASLADTDFAAPTLAYVSALRGRLVEAELRSADYWVDHIRGPVRFADAAHALDDAGARAFIEIGPGPILSGLLRGALTPPPLSMPSMRKGRPETESLLEAAGAWFCRGGELRWDAVNPGGRRVPLPGTPWQRERHWIDAEGKASAPEPVAEPDDASALALELRTSSSEAQVALVTDYLLRAIRRVTRSPSTTDIDADTALLDLGLDSLMGLELRTSIHTELGVDLPLSLVWQDLTVGMLAEVVVASLGTTSSTLPTHEILVPLQPNGSNDPVVCVHPIHGTVHVYQALAAALGTDRPVLGLRAPGLEAGETPVANVSSLAGSHIATLEANGMDGTVHLVGYSFGAAVAHAMATKLGSRVGSLTLLDGSPSSTTEVDLDSASTQLVARSFGLETANCRREELVAYAQEHALFPDAEVVGQVDRMLTVVRAHLNAFTTHAPVVFDGTVHLIRTFSGHPDEPDDLGWSGLANAIDLRKVDCAHEQLLKPPHLNLVVDALKEVLDE